MTLPGWLDPLPDAEEQRALDAWGIERAGIPSLELMERAGSGLADVVRKLAPRGRIAVVCGKGNNGGDGLVAARRLRERGRAVDVFVLGPLGELRGDARANLERLPGPQPAPFWPAALAGAAAVVDAMLGTGFAGAPREPVAGAIAALNASGARVVVACDVPSGVNASTGGTEGAAVRADATVTFHAAKPGLWIAPGKDHAGRLWTVDIGLPPEAPSAPRIGLITPRVLELVPRRGAGSTKFAAGSVLVCGGSRGLTGAPSLAAEAAMRAGAGYVTVAVPGSLEAIFEGRLVEVMSVGLPDEHGALGAGALDAVLASAERVQALVLGPGLGRAAATQAFVRELASRAAQPLLLDADGLNAHAGALERLATRSAPTVLTPHGGELARLLDVDSDAVRGSRLACARAAAERSGSVVVLKGDDTLVADPAGDVAISPGGAPGLATAGTGDVLSGAAGALLAKGLEPFEAACAAVLLHVYAGRRAAAHDGPDGVVASDVIAALPAALGAGGA